MTTPVSLDTQVGGHDGILASADGSVIIKPCLPLEIEFYTALSSNEAFAHLLPFVPKFYGTLKLQGKMDEQGNIGAAVGEETGKDEPFSFMELTLHARSKSLVLQNLAHTFAKPNILDIKLGTRLWDEQASPEKRARMEKAARETTSLETGIRLTGFNVYDHTESRPIRTPKAFGKSISAADLPSGVAKFFPLSTSDVPKSQGLPKDLLHQVLKGITEEVKQIREAVRGTEMRMVGGSLLVIYEADWDTLRQGLQSQQSAKDEDTEEVEDENDSEDADSGDEVKTGPPYLVKLIDFAHTSLRKGDGPDEGVILGLDTTIALFSDRLEEVSRGL